MKNKFTLIITLGVLLTVGLACEFTTANLSEITFADDETGGKNFTSAKQDDKIYALSAINNTGGKHIIRWKVTNENGEEIKLPENEAAIEGARKIWLMLNLKPNVFVEGKYTFEVKLLNEKGDKEIDTKTATLEVRN
jgi:hypothetical protein